MVTNRLCVFYRRIIVNLAVFGLHDAAEAACCGIIWHREISIFGNLDTVNSSLNCYGMLSENLSNYACIDWVFIKEMP